MQKNNSNWSNDGTGFSQRSPFAVYNTQPPITTPPQNVSRNHGPMSLSRVQESSQNLRRNISDVLNNWGPLMHHARSAGTHGRTLRSWLRRTNHIEQPVRPSSSIRESTVINIENPNEPLPPYTGDNYPSNINPEHSQLNFSSLELAERIDNQHSVNRNEENNISVTAHNSNNTNDNNSNIESNIPNSTQTNQGTQRDSQTLTPTDNDSLDKLLNKFTPFFTFLFMKGVYDHREGILIFFGLLVTFTHANSVIKREIAKQNRRSLLSLGILFVNLFVCICFIYFVFREQKLYKNLVFIPPYSPIQTIWDLLWLVGITDFVLKFITIQLKVGITCFPAKLIPYSARGKWYLMLESTSQLYRCIIPIQPWVYYLMEVYQDNIVGFGFTVLYIVAKGSDLTSKVELFIKAIWKLIQKANFGIRPSKDELDTAGSQCPICHDEYNSPIILNCRHIFCEGCVTTWFDREPTCPLCRAKIADDPSWRDGATSFFTQLF